ncbi:MAG: calcium-binding protein [Gemmataceae bacterium]
MYAKLQHLIRRTPRQTARLTQPGIETLEGRVVPAVGTTIQANLLGHLTIEGTNFDDRIIIHHINGQFSIEGVQIHYFNQLLDSVSDLNVGRIYINGYEGNDTIIFDEGTGTGNSIDNDTYINGHGGNDLLIGGAAWTQISGGEGNDEIHGGGSRDWLYGDNGDDVIYGDAGDDFIFGGYGRNLLFGGTGRDDMAAGPEGDTLYGDAGDDILREGLGRDILHGGDGNDQLYIGRGGDWAYGGNGNDWFGWGGSDPNVVYGGAGNDRIFGGSAADLLVGGAGNDTIYGGPGNDRIYGGPGRDAIYPAPGRDFVSQDGDLAVRSAHNLSLKLVNGTLTVTGTAHDDRITITQAGSYFYIDGLTVPRSVVQRMVINPLAGNDLVDLLSKNRGGSIITIPITVVDSLGDDSVLR